MYFYLSSSTSSSAIGVLELMELYTGTLIGDSHLILYVKFHVCTLSTLAPPIGHGCRYFYAHNFSIACPVFKNQLPSISLHQGSTQHPMSISAISGCMEKSKTFSQATNFVQSSPKLAKMFLRSSLRKLICKITFF